MKFVKFANMMRINRHIEILLLDNDCVIVPGLGGFVAHNIEAYYDGNDALFLPPCRTIGFNPALKINDSLLAQSFVEAYDIGYPEAMQQIEDEVDKILCQIEEYGQYEFYDLGVLSRNLDNTLIFEPVNSGILTPRYYGLSSYELCALNQQEKKPLSTAKHKTPVGSVNKPKLVYIETIQGTQEKHISISIKALRDVSLAAAFLLFIFIVGFTSKNRNGILGQQTVKSGILCDMISGEKQLKPLVPGKKKENTIRKATPQLPIHYWSLVLASHVKEKNGLSFVEDLHKKGFSKAHIYYDKESIKILYGSYESAQKAIDELNSLRSYSEFRQSWVFEVVKK